MAISAVALGFSVIGFLHEYRLAVTLHASDTAAINAIRALDPRHLPWGARDLRALVTRCATLQLENGLIRAVPRYRAELAHSCDAIVAAVLAQSPAHARARATALVTAGAAMTAADYARAQAAAPFEPWPLGTRLLAVGHALGDGVPPDLLPPDLLPLFAADADRAIRADWGRRILAGLYVRHPGLRPLLTGVAAQRPATEQRAFLDATREAANG